MAGRVSMLNQAVNGLKRLFFNPNFSALRADFSGNILKEVEMRAAPFLMGNCGRAELATTDGA